MCQLFKHLPDTTFMSGWYFLMWSVAIYRE